MDAGDLDGGGIGSGCKSDDRTIIKLVCSFLGAYFTFDAFHVTHCKLSDPPFSTYLQTYSSRMIFQYDFRQTKSFIVRSFLKAIKFVVFIHCSNSPPPPLMSFLILTYSSTLIYITNDLQ